MWVGFGDQMSETLLEVLMLCCYSICLIKNKPNVKAVRPTVCKAAERGSEEGASAVTGYGAQPVCRKAECYQLCTSGGGQKEKTNKITGMMGLGTL